MKQKFFSIQNKSLGDFGVDTYEKLWQKAKDEGYSGLCIHMPIELKKNDDAPDTFHAIFSTDSEDRHGDIVEQSFDLKAFRKNPVFLDSHNYDSIEHIIGRISPIGVVDNKLQGDIEFAMMNPKGVLAKAMADEGFLRTTSIGFIPLAFDKEGTITKSELLEVSAVSVPANAEALFEKIAAKHKEMGDNPQPPKEDNPEPPADPEPKPDPVPPVVAPEIKPVPEIPKPTTEEVIAKVIKEMADKQRKIANRLARHVHELTENNKIEKKRKIYQALRELSQ